MPGCTGVLQNKDLWEQFHKLDTEMIITKTGRRMFPIIRVQMFELDPAARYYVFLEMVPVGNCRYKYAAHTGWGAAGAEEAQSRHRTYIHPESPATGDHWMSQPVSFGKLKLTNTPAPGDGHHLVLSSMHKYQPRILIVKAGDSASLWTHTESIVFPETQFIAVTAYQNERITRLKIDHNPFAKGFRANGHSKCKRKSSPSERQESSREEDGRKTESPRFETENHRVSEAIRSELIAPTQSLAVHLSYYPYPNYNPLGVLGCYFSKYASPCYHYPYVTPRLQLQNVQPGARKRTDFSIAALMDL